MSRCEEMNLSSILHRIIANKYGVLAHASIDAQLRSTTYSQAMCGNCIFAFIPGIFITRRK